MPGNKFSPNAQSILDLLNEAESVGVALGEDEVRRFFATGQLSENIIKFQEALQLATEGLAARKGHRDVDE
ncbi:hypothetical protein V5F29_05220 [Xanthobacter aminoxidans]|uniref:hypothetical protein n=1 Tax=Xanthobacter aminoxidans TaxID=186280 RepID=UPI00372B5B81